MPRRAELGRVILVVEDRPYLWGVLRTRIGGATAYVRSAHPAELAECWSRWQPWPWMVVVATSTPPAELEDLIGDRPVPVHRLGSPPLGWEALVAKLGTLDRLCVNGVRLLRNRGLLAPDGRMILDLPELEGLLAAGHQGLPWTGDLEQLKGRLQFHRLHLEVRHEQGRARVVGA